MSDIEKKLIAAAMRRLDELKKIDAFDPIHPDSRPTPSQREVIDDFGQIRTQWIVAATQSGKSQTACRLVTWVLANNHPYWQRPEEWREEPLLIIVAGRTGKQIEESLLPKIESYLTAGTYKIVRIGNIAQRLEHENGNRIVFQSLENPNIARERIQSYVAHMVLVDEMPPSSAIIDELQRRVQARSGYFLASFTPLVVNDDIRRMVDSAALPYSKKYLFRMFDNPVYASEEKRAEILASMSTLSESVRNTRLYGEWSISDESVYYFEYDKMVHQPANYSMSWRHIESVDPAMKSALGLTLWAECPNTGNWYCVLSKYIKGLYAPSDWVTAVQRLTAGYNIIRRVSDTAPWFIHQAGSMGIHYSGIYKKQDRKQELIKGLQEKLGQSVFFSPGCDDLIREIQECRWSDRAEEKMVNSSSYHLLDSAQYFCDNIPKREPVIKEFNWHLELLKSNEKRKRMEHVSTRAKKHGKKPVIRKSNGLWK